MTYRIIVLNGTPNPAAGTGVETGANLPGCSLSNAGACDPKEFGSIADAVAYAASRGETPVQAASAAEAWAIVAGQAPTQAEILPTSSIFSDPVTLGIGAFLLWKFLS